METTAGEIRLGRKVPPGYRIDLEHAPLNPFVANLNRHINPLEPHALTRRPAIPELSQLLEILHHLSPRRRETGNSDESEPPHFANPSLHGD